MSLPQISFGCWKCKASFKRGEEGYICLTHREEKNGSSPLPSTLILPDDVMMCEKCYFHWKHDGSSESSSAGAASDLVAAMRTGREGSSTDISPTGSTTSSVPLWKSGSATCASFHKYGRCVF